MPVESETNYLPMPQRARYVEAERIAGLVATISMIMEKRDHLPSGVFDELAKSARDLSGRMSGLIDLITKE